MSTEHILDWFRRRQRTTSPPTFATCLDAAIEIEGLHADNERLRQALRSILILINNGALEPDGFCVENVARAALSTRQRP